MDILGYILAAQVITIALVVGLYFDIYYLKNGRH